MAAFCHRCGVPLRPDAQFCQECGAAITEPEVVRSAPPLAALPARIKQRKGNSMKTGTKLFLGLVAVGLIMCFYNLARPHTPDSVIDSVLAKSTPPPGLLDPKTNVQGYDRAFVDCAVMEAKNGQYSSHDGGDSAVKLMNDKCSSEFSIWTKLCQNAGNTEKICNAWVLVAAQMAIKQFEPAVAQEPGPPAAGSEAPQEQTPVPVGVVVAWTDPITGLMWTKKDNGIDVTWQEATNYCRNLQLGGQSDWRLPTINELQVIYEFSVKAHGQSSGGQAVPWRVKGNLQLSAWGEWSSSLGSASGQAWVFGFGSGTPFSYRFEGRKKPRALCVRGSRE